MPRPAFSAEEAKAIVKHHYSYEVELVEPLPSYDDQNFKITCSPSSGETQGRAFVLKIAAAEAECRGHCDAEATKEMMEMENHAMHLMAGAGVVVPKPMELLGSTGCQVLRLDHLGQAACEEGICFVRLISFLPGTVLAKVTPHPLCLLQRLGACLARMDIALVDWTHPRAARDLTWDLANALRARKFLVDIADPAQRNLAEEALLRFEDQVVPYLAELPRQIVHGDVNDYNVLVAPSALIEQTGPSPCTATSGVGVVDFGDMVETARVCNLAVALAYICMGKDDPLSCAASVVGAYHAVNPLSILELEMIWPMLCARNCQSVLNAAHGAIQEPDNEYLTVSAAPAWDLLQRAHAIPTADVIEAFRQACDIETTDTSASM